MGGVASWRAKAGIVKSIPVWTALCCQGYFCTVQAGRGAHVSGFSRQFSLPSPVAVNHSISGVSLKQT